MITKTLNLLILTIQFNYYLKVQIFRCLVIFLKLLVFETMNRSFYIISKSSYLCTIKLFHRIIYARVAIGTKKCGYKTERVGNSPLYLNHFLSTSKIEWQNWIYGAGQTVILNLLASWFGPPTKSWTYLT